MKKDLISLGCGILLTLGLATPNFSCDHSNPKIVNLEQHKKETQLDKKIKYLGYATSLLMEGEYHIVSKCLEHILEQDGINKPENQDETITLEKVEKLTEEVVDKNIKEESLRPLLLHLAKALYEEEKIEVSSLLLKSSLEKNAKRMESQGYKYIDGFFYHVWTVYNLSLKDTYLKERTNETVLEKTQNKVLEYYKKENATLHKQLDFMFKSIRSKLPKEDSALMEKIKNYK